MTPRPRSFLPILVATLALIASLAPRVAAQPAPLATRDSRIEKILSQVSEQRIADILKKLGSFGTRNTLSSTDSPTNGIGAARQWILDEMTKSSRRLQVSFDTYQVPRSGRITRDIELRNVMAVLPGRSQRRIYISAHYDTFARPPSPPGQRVRSGSGETAPSQPASVPGPRATQPAGSRPPSPPAAQGQAGSGATGGGMSPAPPGPVDNPAPGVNDDGSGTALVMELARVFGESGLDFDATLVFIALAGEEQGLVGANMHAQKAAQEKHVIDAVLNNDMVGNVQAGDALEDSKRVRVFAEGPEDSSSRQLARYVAKAAAQYVPTQQVTLVARHDRFGRGGDHTAFNQRGFTAVRITEAVENYERQHTTGDTFEFVNLPYLMRNVRVNAAVAAALALAPPAPVVTDERGQPTVGRQPSGYDANLRWKASLGAVGYRVYWREAWTPDWQHELAVGNVTELILPSLSIDDYVFGVSAIGPTGNESLVAAYVNPPRGR